MGKVKNRTHADTEWLKARAREYALGGLSKQAIRELLSATGQAGDSEIKPRTLRDWLLESLTGDATRDSMHNVSFSDVLYLRGRAFRATADTEINRAFIMERAYWWGLYISALHVVLRSALSADASTTLPPQFIVKNLNQWYADLRSIRQMTPKLEMEEADVQKLEDDLDAFEKHYGRDIRLPRETL